MDLATTRSDDCGNGRLIANGNIRMPNVRDKNDAQLIARVHRLMFNCIVKHPRFTRDPGTPRRPHPEPAFVGYDEGQMAK